MVELNEVVELVELVELVEIDSEKSMKLETSPKVTIYTPCTCPNEVCIGVAVSVKKIPAHFLLQYQSKSYYIIGQEVYYSIGRLYYIIGHLLHYRPFLLHYRARITVSGVYYIIGWYKSHETLEE